MGHKNSRRKPTFDKRVIDAAVMGLPSHFKFGAATSAYQIEGAASQDGRGPCIWDPFLADKTRSHSGDTGDIACDHYHRFKEDVAIMKELGLDAYRFSISWSRIFPDGTGKVNQAGVDFYNNLVDELLAAGIEPYVTLYHWDLPLALQEKWGGWLSRSTLHAFAKYAEFMVGVLGDRVKNWTTFNEPEVIIAGYIGDGMAPAYNRGDVAFHVGHHLMVAHGLASKAIRSACPDAKVGIVLNFNIVDPKDNTEACRIAAHKRYLRAYSWYLDGLLNGEYPEEVRAELAQTPKLPGVRPRPARSKSGRANGWIKRGDMKLVAQKLDFMGINYYTRFVVDEKGHDYVTPDVARTQMGWQIYPFGLSRLMEEMHRHYKLPPIYITENGAALDDTVTVTADGVSVNDAERAKFVIDHLAALSAATAAGVDVRGYFVWSLLDNLEWPLGFAKTFGIIHVDRKNDLKRTVKDSGLTYARAIHRHRLRRGSN